MDRVYRGMYWNETYQELADQFERSEIPTPLKLASFARWAPPSAISLFLARARVYEKILGVHGHVIDCGVFMGNSMATWTHCSQLFEPYNYGRQVIGFDSGEGLTSVRGMDRMAEGDYAYGKGGEANELRQSLEAISRIKTLGQPRVRLVYGDAVKTIPVFVRDHPELVVALLHLDFDIWEPTAKALHHFMPLMPKGAVIVFDELNRIDTPGESIAVHLEVGMEKLRVERFPWEPWLSWAVIE